MAAVRNSGLQGAWMATPTMSYGERRFGAAYSIRIFVVLGVLGLLIGLWADDPNPTTHPELMWISIALVAAVAGLWIVLAKNALIINDSGVRRESAFGQQEMSWSQITETRYRVVPNTIYGH